MNYEDYKEGVEGLKLSVQELQAQRDALLEGCKNIQAALAITLLSPTDNFIATDKEIVKICIKSLKDAIESCEKQ